MIDEQKQPETNPVESQQNLNSSEKIEKEEFGQPNASASQPEAAATTETSFQDTIGAAGEAELPESEKITELPEPAQIIKALNQENESLKQQLEQQNQQVDALKKRYLSLAAEFDNFRKRTQKEKEELEVQVKCKTIGELLQVVDNFERARTQIKPVNEGEMAIHKSYQGVYKNLVDGLKRLGVSAMRPEGQPFDPNYHEAMLREQTDEHPEGTVLEQLVRGYTLGDRVLRHAMVKVAAPKEPTITSQEETTEKENLENQES